MWRIETIILLYPFSTHYHTNATHAWADVIFFAWSTVDDKLNLAAPEIDIENGYISGGMIQLRDKQSPKENKAFKERMQDAFCLWVRN